MRILIVEDEPTLGKQLKSTLEQTGYAVDLSTDALRDGGRVVQRLRLARENQRRRQNRLGGFTEQRAHCRMIGHPHADRAAPWMLHPPRHFIGRSQQEREFARRALADNPELRIVHSRKAADLREVAANERQMVAGVDTAQRANPPRGICVADPAPERIARIGRIGEHAAGTQQRSGGTDQARLRMGRMELEQLSHRRANGKAII